MHSSLSSSLIFRTLKAGLFSILLLLGSLSAQAQNNWTGATSRDWNTATNWSAGVPTATSDAVIPLAPTNQPILSTTAVAKSVVVSTGASLSITSAGSLTINGSTGAGLTNSGTVVNGGSIAIGNTAGPGTFGLVNNGTFTNMATGSISADRASDRQLHNVAGGMFTNMGQIGIGLTGRSNFGIYNEGTFNHQGGSIIASGNNSAILNESATFTNTASITITTVTSGGPGRGIHNRGTFNNNTGGNITLDRCLVGVFNETGTFNNAATILMGASISVTTAILNQGSTVFNNSTCASLIDIVSNSPITTSGGSFSNAGTIIERYNGTSNITTNTGVVQNLNGGTFTISSGTPATTSLNLVWTGCTSTDWNTSSNWNLVRVPLTTDDVLIPSGPANQPIVGATTSAVAKSVTLTAGSSLTVLANGILTIANSTSIGLTNDAGTLMNNGTIRVDGTGSTGVFSLSNSSVVNSGTIAIGQSTSLGRHGIVNQGVFTNTATGQILVDRIKSNPLGIEALFNLGTFANAGIITVGSSTSAGQDGIYNGNVFTNLANGRIYIDRVYGNGIWNASSAQLFENAGLIVVGANAPTGISGILNDRVFTNLAGGEIQVNQPSDNGLANRPGGNFTNHGRVQIGLIASPVGHGIANILSGTVVNGTGGEIIISPLSSATAAAVYNTGTFENQACAKLTIADNLFNNSLFTNAGLFTVNTAQVHSNTALTNNGTISYLQNSFIPNVTNNALILQSFTVCSSYSPALQASVSNSLTVGTTWYTDPALTNAAGTYNQATSTFTVTNLAAPNSYTLYMTVTDGACSYTAAIPVTTKPVPVVTLTPSPSITLTCAQPLITLTAPGGGSSYSFSPGTTPTASASVVSVSLAGVYSVTVTNTDGCAGTASTTITGSSTPVSASLIPGSSGVCSSGGVTLMASGGVNYAFSGPGLSQNGSSPTAVATQSGTYSVLVTGANGCTALASQSLTITQAPSVVVTFPNGTTAQGTGIASIQLPPLTSPVLIQATGGVLYELVTVIDRINGYEIRQTNSNTTGIFTINRLGLFTLTVTGDNGCSRVVQWVVQ